MRSLAAETEVVVPSLAIPHPPLPTSLIWREVNILGFRPWEETEAAEDIRTERQAGVHISRLPLCIRQVGVNDDDVDDDDDDDASRSEPWFERGQGIKTTTFVVIVDVAADD